MRCERLYVVDSNAADNLFAGKDPVGKTIEIGSEPFTVIWCGRTE